ncbi:hypothetical protein M8J77_023730 [Diaphorina citri]|nr:hypothetical protein M8J77_023730 [Diaphorina citri]
MYPFTRKHHSPTSLKRNSKSAGKPTNSRGASREENEMTCEEYSVYLQDIVKSRRQASSPVKSSSLRQKEEILLTSLRGRTVDCDNSTRLGPNKQYLFEHLLQTDPSCSRNDQEVFQSVPQLAVYDLSPNSIRPNETMWRRKSDSNALPCSNDVQENNKSVLYVKEESRRKSDSNTLHVEMNRLQINGAEPLDNESDGDAD